MINIDISTSETLMDNNLQIPLDLPDVRVLNVSKIERGAWLILVESTVTETPCRKCGKPITDLHGLDTKSPSGQRLITPYSTQNCSTYRSAESAHTLLKEWPRHSVE
jgi:hypothetical protein